MRACVYAHACMCVFMHMCVCVCVFMHMCVCVCVYLCMCDVCVCVFMHIVWGEGGGGVLAVCVCVVNVIVKHRALPLVCSRQAL